MEGRKKGVWGHCWSFTLENMDFVHFYYKYKQHLVIQNWSYLENPLKVNKKNGWYEFTLRPLLLCKRLNCGLVFHFSFTECNENSGSWIYYLHLPLVISALCPGPLIFKPANSIPRDQSPSQDNPKLHSPFRFWTFCAANPKIWGKVDTQFNFALRK
jgi:hypothetical protein